MVVNSLLFQCCFADCKKLLFNPPGIGNTPTLTSSKHTRNRNTPFTTEAREVKGNAQRFFTGWPSVVVFVCLQKCVVGKLPCNVLAFVWALAQTDCKALATTHLCRLFVHVSVWLDGPWRRHSFAAPTPRRCDRRKDKRTKHMGVLDFATWHEMAVIFTVYKAARTPAKKIARRKK